MGAPIKVCQDLLEEEIPEEINIMFLRLFPWCLDFALTMKVILNKLEELVGKTIVHF